MAAPAFDVEFETSILGQAMRDPEFTSSAIRVCDTHHFATPQHAWIWGAIRRCWSQYRELPTFKVLFHKAGVDFKDESKRLPYLRLVKTLMSEKPKAPRFALDELEKFVKFVNLQLAAEQIATALEKGNVDDGYKALSTASRLSVGVKKYSIIHWHEEFEERQARRKYEHDHPDEILEIPTGWPTIDSIINGVRACEVALIMATTGRGKSICLNNIAHASASRGFRTLMVPFEMPAHQVATRGDSRWLGIDYKKLKRFDLTASELREIELKRKRAAKQFKGVYKIASFPVRHATMADVYGLLDDLKHEYDWTPQLICFDSLDHVRSTMTNESFRLQQTDVYWEAKALGETIGCAVWSSTHASRDWAEKVATAEASGESYDKSRIADLVLSLNDPDAAKRFSKKKKVVEDDEDGEDDDDEAFTSPVSAGKNMELFVAKYRDGASLRTIPVIADYAKMHIYEAASGASKV